MTEFASMFYEVVQKVHLVVVNSEMKKKYFNISSFVVKMNLIKAH